MLGDKRAGLCFFRALSAGAGPFICCSEALLMQKEYVQNKALERAGDNNATIHYFKTNTIWSVDLSGSVKLVPLKEQLAREEHVTSPRAEDAPWGQQGSRPSSRPALQAQL